MIFRKQNFPSWYDPQENYNRIDALEKETVKILEKTTDKEQFHKTQLILNNLALVKKEIEDMMVKYG